MARTKDQEVWSNIKVKPLWKITVFIYGQAANKFVFTSDSTTLSNQQTQSVRTILGEQNILELSGEDHKRVRGALVSFLKPESLKQYVGKMDEEVKKHLELHWQGKQQVKVRTLMLPKVCHMELISNVQPNEQALVNAYNSQEKFIGIRS
jgi:cytochrome P450